MLSSTVSPSIVVNLCIASSDLTAKSTFKSLFAEPGAGAALAPIGVDCVNFHIGRTQFQLWDTDSSTRSAAVSHFCRPTTQAALLIVNMSNLDSLTWVERLTKDCPGKTVFVPVHFDDKPARVSIAELRRLSNGTLYANGEIIIRNADQAKTAICLIMATISASEEPIKVVTTGMHGSARAFNMLAATPHLPDSERTSVSTIGVDFFTVRYPGTETTKIQLWDITGQERYKAIADGYFRGAKDVLLIADLSFALGSEAEFIATIQKWAREHPSAIIVPVQTDVRVANLSLLTTHAPGLRLHDEIIDISPGSDRDSAHVKAMALMAEIACYHKTTEDLNAARLRSVTLTAATEPPRRATTVFDCICRCLNPFANRTRQTDDPLLG